MIATASVGVSGPGSEAGSTFLPNPWPVPREGGESCFEVEAGGRALARAAGASAVPA